MKKLLALVLAVMMVASMAAVASAESTTTLTTTVPAAAYTLNIPADQKIEFGATETNIGTLSVTGSSGFADGKNLNVTLTYDSFECGNTTTTIPFSINLNDIDNRPAGLVGTNVVSGSAVTFKGNANGTVSEFVTLANDNSIQLTDFLVRINSADWGKALAGEYTATITFTAEVVVAG